MRLVRFLLTSFSDRRVLDELDPDSTQSARDQQPIHNRPAGDLFSPQSHRPPVYSIESSNSQTRKHLANPLPARLAYRLEARLTLATILSNVYRSTEQSVIRYTELKAEMPSELQRAGARARATFQETTSTQWQKN